MRGRVRAEEEFRVAGLYCVLQRGTITRLLGQWLTEVMWLRSDCVNGEPEVVRRDGACDIVW